ncbi:hypothetical protein PGT21_016606 [Puccinia graminis f. sp. tritici]|uniref:Uncharacterized protein n=1 Tax=Puccinia graminis f. sp. tritici TaxID=56615 RepID=A0A5B0Q609_PUCGR|nr:hypothetical protein PGT21_016606 [Puccinia graminis f. sp. tritici]
MKSGESLEDKDLEIIEEITHSSESISQEEDSDQSDSTEEIISSDLNEIPNPIEIDSDSSSDSSSEHSHNGDDDIEISLLPQGTNPRKL